ncbi:MAG: VWA domain-containing protein, partial [Deltaproteobacteria bacterium]|nr:VWA domain-containing protein [Deltaproteobacteria bacterium]
NHVQQLENTFNSKGPNGLTPMSAALAGATKWAMDQQSMGEGKEKVVVVFLTDGEPTACDLNINNIANIADDAFKKKEVLTFAVGLQGSNMDQMNKIAEGGHTDKAFFIGNGNAQDDLLAALKKIQDSVVSCTYAMPESPDPNQTIDPNQVNITYSPGSGDPGQTLIQVTDESKCGATDGTWFYDDPINPQAIILCPGTCEKLQADDKAKVKVVLGCATQAK